jgi:hypothetical protein
MIRDWFSTVDAQKYRWREMTPTGKCLATSLIVGMLISGSVWYSMRNRAADASNFAGTKPLTPKVVSTVTIAGSPLASFFEGLPANPLYAGGRLPKAAALRPRCGSDYVSRTLSRVQSFLGLNSIVHAQDCPVPPGYDQEFYSCSGQPCYGGFTYYTVYDMMTNEGSVFSDYMGCQPNCMNEEWITCPLGE